MGRDSKVVIRQTTTFLYKSAPVNLLVLSISFETNGTIHPKRDFVFTSGHNRPVFMYMYKRQFSLFNDQGFIAGCSLQINR